MGNSILILGGGAAGLSAGLELVERGFQVTILEANPEVGGRARAWKDPGKGPMTAETPVPRARAGAADVMIPGWFLATRQLLARLQATETLVEHDSIAVFSRDRGFSLRRGLGLPGPLKQWGRDLPRYPEFSLQEQAATRFLSQLLASFHADRLDALDEISLRAWGVGFSASMHPFLRHLLDPYTFFTLMTTGHSISVRTAAAVMRHRVGVPSPLLGTFQTSAHENFLLPLADAIRDRGGIIRTEARAIRLLIGRTRIEGVDVQSRRRDAGTRSSSRETPQEETLPCETLYADYVISSLPPERLIPLLTQEMLKFQYFRDISRLRTEPLATLQLFLKAPLDGPEMPLLHADSALGLYGIELKSTRREGGGQGTVLSCVLTHYEAFVALSDAELVALTLRDLRAMFPQLRPEWIERSTVTRYNDQPCFLHSTGSWQLRPNTRSPFGNFLLAGDWVRTEVDLACLEGAVLSGWMAANAILMDRNVAPVELPNIPADSAVRVLGRLADVMELPQRTVRRVLARTDRRRFPRLERALEAYLEDRESHVGWSSVLITNMGYGGVFFVSAASPRVGARIRLRIRVPEGDPIELRGRVMRVEEERDHQAGGIGVGCKVSPVDDEHRARWELLVGHK